MGTDEQEDTYEPIVQARDREAAEEPIHCVSDRQHGALY